LSAKNVLASDFPLTLSAYARHLPAYQRHIAWSPGEELVTRYNFHVFDSLTVGEDTGKRDPRRKKNEAEITGTMRLLYAASQGDLDELRAALATGCNSNAADYDGRTALHLAAAEGHLAAARFLLGSGPRQTPPTAGEVPR